MSTTKHDNLVLFVLSNGTKFTADELNSGSGNYIIVEDHSTFGNTSLLVQHSGTSNPV